MAKIFMSMAAGLFFLSVMCSPKEIPATRAPAGTGVPEMGEAKSSSSVAREAWEIEWEKTLKEAQKEGGVLIFCTGIGPGLKSAIPLFKQRYGINLEVVIIRGAEAAPKLLRERANGIFLADVISAGLNVIYGMKQARPFEPLEPVLILPEVVDPKLWYGGKLPWADKERLIFSLYKFANTDVTINTQMVKPEEIKSLYDFLDPQWKGKLLISDPTVSGSGFNAFSTLLVNKTLDLDFFRQLVKQEPGIIRDQRLQVEWLVRGKYPTALWTQSSSVAEHRQAGAPVMDLSSKEETALSTGGGNLALLNRGPHPNAARILVNWILSKEGQIIIQKYAGNQSARDDITIEGVEPNRLRKPGVKYSAGASDNEEWVLHEQDKYYELAKQVFAPLMK